MFHVNILKEDISQQKNDRGFSLWKTYLRRHNYCPFSSLRSGTLLPLSAVERWPGKARVTKKKDNSPRVVRGRTEEQLSDFLCGMSLTSLYIMSCKEEEN